MNRLLNQRIRQALYSLSKEYGAGPFYIHRYLSATVDHETGVKTENTESITLRRVIVLPARLSRNAEQTISMISANKAFVYGATYDSRVRTFIIDRRHSGDWVLNKDDWFVFAGKKYSIQNIQEFEYDTAWVVVGEQLDGEVPSQAIRRSESSTLNLTSTATGEL